MQFSTGPSAVTSSSSQTASELYSHLHEELDLRLAESERVGYGFVLPGATVLTAAPNAPKFESVEDVQTAA